MHLIEGYMISTVLVMLILGVIEHYCILLLSGLVDKNMDIKNLVDNAKIYQIIIPKLPFNFLIFSATGPRIPFGQTASLVSENDPFLRERVRQGSESFLERRFGTLRHCPS